MLKQYMPFRQILLTNGGLRLLDGERTTPLFNKCGIFYCQRGCVKLGLEGRHYTIRPGDIYIYMAATTVRLLSKTDDADGMLVEANLEYVLPFVHRVLDVEHVLALWEEPCFHLTPAQCAHLEYLLGNLWERINAEEETNADSAHRTLKLELIKSMGQTVCYEIFDMYFSSHPQPSRPKDKRDAVFHEFMVALFHHYRRERDVTFYAHLQHLSPRYFSAIIKERTGSTALQWIIRMVVAEAKQLLEATDLSIKEIAFQLNFPTQSFFGKYFKQYTGLSPKDYRLANRRP